MRRDHRPYFLKKLSARIEKCFADHYLRPQFESLGPGASFVKPWHVKIWGEPIDVGAYVNVVAASDGKVRLTVWGNAAEDGRISVGDYCLICPGVRISSAAEILIGDNCMLANGVYVTDSDWHDIYNRLATGYPQPVRIEENAWIGDSAIICKGVTIGRNSIIGAGAIVTSDVPANTIAAGNPARVIKQLDPDRKITPRSQWFSNPEQLFAYFDIVDRNALKRNSALHWVRYMLFPNRND